jgi:hypothetical protein
MTMTLQRLHSLSIIIALAAGGCGLTFPDLPGQGSDAEASGSSTGGSASATSTSGGPPITSGDTLDSSTTALDSSTTADDGGSTFIDPEPPCGYVGEGEFTARCTIIECSVADQDCPEGEKCVPWSNDGGPVWTANRCVPLPEDPVPVGQPCVAMGSPVSGIDDCERGALCFEVDPRTLQGTCVALCDEDDPTTCGDDQACAAYDGFRPQVCLSRCDPTDPAACPADEGCRPIGPEVLCVPTITLPEGLACGPSDQHCAVAETCLSAEGLARCDAAECCTAWCDLSAPDPDLPCATAGELCQPYFEIAPAGLEHVGVCALPP